MRDFREIKVWQKSHLLTLEIYRLTKAFPAEEKYGITTQIRRATASISTNIAEGCGRHSQAELAQFMQISMGSASELEYLLLLAHDLNLINEPQFNQFNKQTVEVKKMLATFIKRLRS